MTSVKVSRLDLVRSAASQYHVTSESRTDEMSQQSDEQLLELVHELFAQTAQHLPARVDDATAVTEEFNTVCTEIARRLAHSWRQGSEAHCSAGPISARALWRLTRDSVW